MGVIAIDYETLKLVVVLMFALVGFSRGLLKEGITTLLLSLLVGLLYYPTLVAPLAERLNAVLKVLKILFKSLGSLDTQAVASSAGVTQDIFSPDNPYNLLLWLLIILLALSYIGGQVAVGDKKLSALSRILGGIAGALNGFIAISLFKEYLLRYLEKLPLPAGTAGVAAATAGAKGGGVAVSLQNLPQQPFIGSVGPTALTLIGLALVVVLSSLILKRSRSGKKSG